ncbi:MAG: glycoside hydrolase family 1 protein [Anaerolineae bacterium]|nr:glycoside hydrolase family 1 protein [Anaerolineae bacterium]
MADATHIFPVDFLWGTATAAHQVEGDNTNNDWYAWEQKGGGRVFEDQVSGKACKWWSGHAEKDIKRMADLNTNAHRLSIEWSRIEPEPGQWNHDAIDRYRAILTAMRDAGVQPMVTLHHFTNPIWVAEQGGWLNPEISTLFQRFVQKAVAEMADLCDVWCTINEPSVYAAKGFYDGSWPPGQANLGHYFQVMHNMAEAHAAAYHAIHELRPQARVGMAHHMVYWKPLRSANPLDRTVTHLLDGMFNGLFLDVIATGQWRPIIGKKGEIPQAKGTLDWIGLNYYQRWDAAFKLNALKALGITYSARPGAPKGPQSWGEFYPEGLLELIKRLHRQFNKPIYITENGVPDETDTIRPGFLLEHLQQVWKAIMHSIPVKGYYFWSLVDNFEWAEGLDPRYRFGLYGVDFKTQKRTLRNSGKLYKEIAKTNAISSDMARRYAPEVVERMFPGKVSPR